MTLAMETLEGDHHRQYANFPEVAEFIVAEEFLLCLTKGGICIVYNRGEHSVLAFIVMLCLTTCDHRYRHDAADW